MNARERVRSERLSPALSSSVMLLPVNLPDTLARLRCNADAFESDYLLHTCMYHMHDTAQRVLIRAIW